MADFIVSLAVVLVNLLGIATALAASAYAYFLWSYQYWKKRNMPYFEPSIPFGAFKGSALRKTYYGEVYKELYNKVKAKGWKHCGLYLVTSPVYFIVDLDLLRNVLTRDFKHFVDRGLYTNDRDDPISSHLFNIGGTKWRNLRAKLTPTFTSGKLKSMFQTLVDCGLVLEKHLEESVDSKTPVDIKDILGCFSTDIIGSCAFGLECNSFKDPNSPFRECSKKITQRPAATPKVALAMNFPNIARALRVRIAPKDVSDFLTKTIEDTVAYRESNNYVRKDFLQLLIGIKNSKEAQENGYKGDGRTLTMPEIVAQSYVFFSAGFETSSTTMSFALYELALHPEIQDKVREEIKTVLAKHDNQVTYDSLSELKYMAQVIDETLRLHPPVGVTARQCVEDYKVSGEDVIIEKGTRVLISIRGIHHDPEFYDNPEVFDPERFTEENKKTRHPYAYIPFGEGPRNCIGSRFGLMQSKVGLTCILRKFKVTLNEKTQLPLKMSTKNVILDAEGGIWLNLLKA